MNLNYNETLLKQLFEEDSDYQIPLYYEYETTSTNDIAKALARQDTFPKTALAIAEIQTAGRGRMGRHWESPAGNGIWMSLLCHPNISQDKISGITLLAALAITKALKYLFPDIFSKKTIGIKWPNDVVIDGKKICGILTEMVSDGSNNHVICGIGVNINTANFPEELKDKATSLYLESGKKFSREILAHTIIKELVNYIHIFEKTGDLSGVTNEYNSMLVHLNKEVCLTSANGEFRNGPYVARGIESDGSLVVTDKDNTRLIIQSGEISVRGVLGYV